MVRKRVRAIAAEREGYTGAFPVVVGTPGAESERRRAARRTERPGDADRQ